jgi:hypothetical protein
MQTYVVLCTQTNCAAAAAAAAQHHHRIKHASSSPTALKKQAGQGTVLQHLEPFGPHKRHTLRGGTRILLIISTVLNRALSTVAYSELHSALSSKPDHNHCMTTSTTPTMLLLFSNIYGNACSPTPGTRSQHAAKGTVGSSSWT